MNGQVVTIIMKPNRSVFSCCALLAAVGLANCLALGPVASAAEVASPADSYQVLAALQIPNVKRFDTSVRRVLQEVGVPLPGPLELAVASGVGASLDSDGLAALYVVGHPDKPSTARLCLRIAVTDSDRFISAVGGTPGDQPAEISIAGESILAGSQDGAVLLMDANDQEVIAALLADASLLAKVTPRWQAWTDQQDAVLTVTPPGAKLLRTSLPPSTGRVEESSPDLFENVDEDGLFGFDQQDDISEEGRASRATGRAISQAIEGMVDRLGHYPLAASALESAEAVAVGVRLENEGPFAMECRVGWQQDSPFHPMPSAEEFTVPHSFLKLPVVACGGGALPGPMTRMIGEGYVQLLSQMFDQTNYHDEDLAEFKKALVNAARPVTGLAWLQRPTDEEVGIHTNQFLLLETSEADMLVDRIVAVVKSWNWLMDNAEGEILQLGSQSLKLRQKETILFDADMAAVFSPDPSGILPEVRNIMEKLFGEDGYYRLYVVRMSDRQVLIGSASAAQTESLIASLETGEQAPEVKHSSSSAADRLPTDHQFWLRVYPHDYSQWQRNRRRVEVGNVLGGNPVKVVPELPPVSAALSIHSDELHIHLECPAETYQLLGGILLGNNQN